MAVDVSRTQDVYKDAGQSVNFTTLLLNRKDRDAELEVIQDMADGKSYQKEITIPVQMMTKENIDHFDVNGWQ